MSKHFNSRVRIMWNSLFDSDEHTHSDKLAKEEENRLGNYFRYGLLIFSSSIKGDALAFRALNEKEFRKRKKKEYIRKRANSNGGTQAHKYLDAIESELRRQQHQQQSKNVKSFNLFDFPHIIH